MFFSKDKSVTISYEDIDIVLCRWNLQRIRLICIITIIMQLVNIFDSGVQSTPYLFFATIAMAVLSLGYLLYYYLFFDKIKECKRITTVTVTVFWLLYVIGNTFFCARDAQQQRTPHYLIEMSAYNVAVLSMSFAKQIKLFLRFSCAILIALKR